MKSNLKKVVLLVLVILLILLLLRQCSDRVSTSNRPADISFDQTYMLIPPEATFIAVFNTPQVLSDINFAELRVQDRYINSLRQYYQQNPPFARVFASPEQVGVDVKEHAVFYIAVGTQASEVYSNAIFSIKDKAAFEKAIIESNRGAIQKEAAYSHITIDGMSSVAWNDDYACFISTDESYEKLPIFNRIFTQSKAKYFDKDNPFYQFITASKSDMAYWVDLSSYAENQLHATAAEGEFSKLLLRGNHIYGEADFREGEVDASVLFDFNKILSTAQGKVFKDGYDTDIIQLIPSTNASALVNASINMEGLFSLILDDIDMKVEARNTLAQYGLTLDDLTKAVEGDMLFAAYPSEIPGKSATIYGVKIKDHDHFEVLLNVWQDLGNIALESSNIYRVDKGVPPFFPIAATYPDKLQRLIIRGDYAYVSLDKSVIDHIASYTKSDALRETNLMDRSDDDILFSGYFNNGIKEVRDRIKSYAVEEIKFNYEDQKLELRFQFNDDDVNPLRQILAIE